MTRGYLLHAQFARANPEVVLSDRSRAAGLWFGEREPTFEEVNCVDDLEPRLVGFIHIPTLVTRSADLTEDDYAVFVKTVGHVFDLVWAITAGLTTFWIPPDWEQVRRLMVDENIEHAKLLVRYPFGE